MKLRLKRKELLVLLCIGIGYFVWITCTNIRIPCIFRMMSGMLCPGCGMTTLVERLVRLDLSGAYAANGFVLMTLWFPLFEFFVEITDERLVRINNLLLVFYLISLIIWGICRNV